MIIFTVKLVKVFADRVWDIFKGITEMMDNVMQTSTLTLQNY